ncbi:MAG: YlbF family regulator [Firmicutes bacterium]|nr:YlbF family regulator [Bacillota bacterium]
MEVQKKAQELADAIMNSAEYQKMIEAREKVQNHQAARVMLRDFQNKQLELHKQQMEGQPITQEQEEQLQQLFGVISINPYIRELFEAEFAFSGLMLEVNDVLANVLDLKDEDEELEGEISKLEIPEKKILIPGQDN